MKKLVSFVVFAALLIWSWTIVHSVSQTGFETHAGIQDKLSELIENLVQAKKPSATDITVEKIITENLGADKVKAYFTYSFQEAQKGGESSEQVIQGEAILRREPSETPSEDKWILQSVKTTNDSISFVEGTVIGPETTVESLSPSSQTEEPTSSVPPKENESTPPPQE